MALSFFLAQVFGLTLTITGLGILINRDRIDKIMSDMEKNHALTYLAGMFTLIIGTLLILTHNIWYGGWAVIITVLGWLTFLKGIFYMLFPKAMFSMAKSMQKQGWYNFASIVILILGIYLMYVGFNGIL